MPLNFRRVCSVLEVDPADAENVDLTLGRCPDDNRHRMLKGRADYLRDNLYEPNEAVEMLRAWLTRSERYSGEIYDTVRRSWDEIDHPIILSKGKKQANPLNTKQVVDLFRSYGGYCDLLEQTGYVNNPEIEDTTTQEWLRWLYLPSDLLCVGVTAYDTKVAPLKEILPRFAQAGDSANVLELKKLYRTNQYSLMTPAVYREREILSEDGRYQGRCNANILERKYWVLEFDIAEGQGDWKGVLPHRDYDGFDLQAGIILYLLEQEFPIVSIVHSGKKSLHVWCSGRGMSHEEIEAKVLSTAVYGSDWKAGQIDSQFFRLPNPVHPSRPQSLLYLNQDFIHHGRAN